MYVSDTIAAISTAPGEAGIGIVRMSGKDAFAITERIFQSSAKKAFSELANRTINHGFIIEPETGKKIDEVLISKMKGPHTYTTEDVVEINCHGGTVPVRRMLELLLRNGARLAEAGEFTKRAFLNGRIDLSQAEAVIDIITSKTNTGMEMALGQLEGDLSNPIEEVRAIIINMLAHIEANIDYPEYDIEEVTYDTLRTQAKQVENKIQELLKSADTGKILREGLNTVIIGKPNVGKSSLLNALLKEGRAIVTDIPGTTRDVIEEYININGIPLKIVDTAGIRETQDLVEKIGVDKSRQHLEQADLILFLLDMSNPLDEEDQVLIKLIQEKKAIILLNKTDLPSKVSQEEINQYFKDKTIIEISALKGEGLDRLEEAITDIVFGGQVTLSHGGLVSNVRHKNLLEKALHSIGMTMDTIEGGLPPELVSVDLKDCWDYLGQVTGDTVSEEIISQIFANFCIGK